MKQGIKHYLEVRFCGMDSYWDQLDHIDVVFSQFKGGDPAKECVYTPGSNEGCMRNGDTLLIPWEREETYKFHPGSPFWMDIRPTLQSGEDLQVDPVELHMTWTLFKEVDA